MHRKLLRNATRGLAPPLLIAVAAVVGGVSLLWASESTAAATYRISIPGLSAEPVVAPPSVSAGNVHVRNVGTAVLGSLTAFGEVQNDSSGTVTNVKVRAAAVGADGGALGTVTAVALSTQIAAHGAGLFSATFTGVTDPHARVTVTVESFDLSVDPVAAEGVSVTAGGPRPLELVTYDPQTHEKIVTNSKTNSVLSGTLMNAGAHTLTNIDVLIAFYDGAGRVALIVHGGPVATAFASPGPPRVAAGQSATFTAQLVNADYLAINGPITTAGFVNATILP